ncbi:MAG: hypothetical protein J5922_05350 [Clostridia bacterium]|nr:hypothetical protein [Clostridia bacterium]
MLKNENEAELYVKFCKNLGGDVVMVKNGEDYMCLDAELCSDCGCKSYTLPNKISDNEHTNG